MKQNIHMQIGKKIRDIRQKKGISLRDFEVTTGIARGDLSKIETGKRNPTLETIQRIADALHCEVEILLKEKAN